MTIIHSLYLILDAMVGAVVVVEIMVVVEVVMVVEVVRSDVKVL